MAIPYPEFRLIISLEDFQSYEETAYLMASQRNAERLNQAIAQVEAGKADQDELIDDSFKPGQIMRGMTTCIANKQKITKTNK